MRGLMGLFAERPQDGAEPSAGTFPDSAVLALAAALDRDKLERLVLPAALVEPLGPRGVDEADGFDGGVPVILYPGVATPAAFTGLTEAGYSFRPWSHYAPARSSPHGGRARRSIHRHRR